MNLVIATAPVLEPLTLPELLLHLRLDVDTVDEHLEDTLYTELIKAARVQVEEITRRALLTQTWDAYLDDWPDENYIVLPFGNLQTVTSVKYKDTTGTETTMVVTTEYLTELNGEQCGRIVLPYGKSWPGTTLYPSHPITIRFTAGWTAAASIPGSIRTAVKMLCADMYVNREAQFFTSDSRQGYVENKTVERLLASARLREEF